jgi:hypothetical protein
LEFVLIKLNKKEKGRFSPTLNLKVL